MTDTVQEEVSEVYSHKSQAPLKLQVKINSITESKLYYFNWYHCVCGALDAAPWWCAHLLLYLALHCCCSHSIPYITFRS